MPNERVRYFKPPEEISDKIVYVKDKDLLGFDSASSPAFQFNLWNMKKFGMSENFILMDDDCFIGRPLKKSNFFYEENGEIFPALITKDYYELKIEGLKKKLEPLIKNINSVNSHSPNGFSVMQKNSLLFLYDILGDDNSRFGKPLIEPSFTHNAIPVKQSDIKEIYDYIEKLYKYKEETLRAKERQTLSLQPQTIFMAYPRNKYDRRVKMVSSTFFDLTQFKGKINSDLYVINISNRNYANSYFVNEIKYLEKLYPDKTPYELGNEKNENNNNNNKKEEKTDKSKENKEPEKKEEEKDINYKSIMEYLDKEILDKKKLKNDIMDITNKVNELYEKYDKVEKQIEELLSKQINETISMNKTITENYKSQSYIKSGYMFILIIIIILISILFYLIKNGYLSMNFINKNGEFNYLGVNNLSDGKNENEMALMNSKIDI